MSGLAYLGPLMDHRDSLELLLRGAGIDLTIIPDVPSWIAETTPFPSTVEKIISRGLRVRDHVFGTRDQDYLQNALRLIDEGQVKCVVAYWGTRPLTAVKALKRLRPHVKFVLNVLCHPLGLSNLIVKIQNFVLGNAMPSLDGLIFSSAVMQHYIEDRIEGAKTIPSLVLPPFWCSAFGPTAPVTETKTRPNILFVGRMDWKAGQPSDNLTEALADAMRAGVDVHFGWSEESHFDSPHAFPFDPMLVREVINFATPFDVSLIAYNLKAASVTDRFDVTVPDRVITSACAGVPLAIPSRGFSACREYLKNYGAVFEYESLHHLVEFLHDRPAVDAMRRLAQERRSLYRAETNLDLLLAFLAGIQPELIETYPKVKWPAYGTAFLEEKRT